MVKSILSSALFAATALAASRTTAPSGSITVAKSGGDYDTISSAVAALSTTTTDTQTIFIEAGEYEEQVLVPALAGKLIIYGETEDDTSYADNTVNVTYGLGLADVSSDDETATFRIHTSNAAIYNINFINSGGASAKQALAVSAYETEQGFYGVGMYGYQDTLLAETGNQVYLNSYIEGAIDFIFGQHARAWFQNCDIRVVEGPSSASITANGRSSETDTSFYVIHKSTVAAAAGNDVASGTYYLGRPWSEYARVCFQETSMTDVINALGWTEWSTSEPNTEYVTFEEYDNTGAGSEGTRASFSSKISTPYTISTILGSDYADWVDTTYL
ncbi:pectinesterase pmeA [Aspergillus heteromorphus CBS 117.55]|uniref:Pectinesterase n=1 Tax=Aspergillus heteromorphus CBS 117.55 TaxID=1448321 RepID=A0A317VSY3_9EURO|nr:pectinesterase pmeA [Aspergillus heteromorphus CBS 117.55]PWY75030.1 pectinesterase pmeA [Aspergillus heteromorphus CBS 117.55]